MKFWGFLFMVLIFFAANAQENYTARFEIRDENNAEFISNARLNFTELDTTLLLNFGQGVFSTSRFIHHIHIQARGYEFKELDVDLRKDSLIVIYLHETSLEMRETVVEHILVGNSDRNTSISVSTINKMDMLTLNPSSFAETLETIPGVTTNNVGVGIARPVIRGLAGTRIYVADMGLRQEGQQWGNDHGLELDQYGIERVEVLKGPATIVYGPDAMAGVIHILSDLWPENGSIKADVVSGIKTNNSGYFNSFGIKGQKSKVYFNLRYSQKRYGDTRVPIDSFTYLTFHLPIFENRQKNTAGKEQNASLSLGFKTKKSKFWIRASQYYLQQGLFAGAIGQPGAYGLGHGNDFRNIELPSQNVRHSKIDAHHITRLKKNMIWSTDVGYQRNNRLEQSIADLHGVLLNAPSDTAHYFILETYQIRSTLKKQWSTKTSLSSGITTLIQRNTHAGFEFLLPDYSSSELGLYALLEHEINQKSRINFGVRSDYATVQTTEKRRNISQEGQTLDAILAPALNKQFINWAAQLGFNYEVSHHHFIKMNAARSYRFPRAVELAMNGVHHGTFRHEVGNPNLTTEVAYQLDAMYEYHTNKRLLTITPFINYYENFIYLRPTGQFSTLPDAGQLFKYTQHDALLSGGEILWHESIEKNLMLQFKAEYVFAYNIDLGGHLPFIPPLTMSLSPTWKKEKLSGLSKINITPNIQYSFGQSFVDNNELRTPGFFLLNADISFSALKGKSWKKMQLEEGIQFNFGFRNLLNTSYLKHLSRYRLLDITEPGFNFVFSVRLPLVFNEK
jgi:iron complex outermembrane receptor protein